MKIKRTQETTQSVNAECKACVNYDPPSGQCRINPPDTATGKWPVVEATDWCAKFDPAE